MSDRKAFNKFTESLEEQGFDFFILDDRAIKKNCGKGTYNQVINVLSQANREETLRPLVFVFRKEENSQCCWPSEDYPGEIIVNLAKHLETSELVEANRVARKTFREEIKLGAAELESQQT